jgi:hypothetical protein
MKLPHYLHALWQRALTNIFGAQAFSLKLSKNSIKDRNITVLTSALRMQRLKKCKGRV